MADCELVNRTISRALERTEPPDVWDSLEADLAFDHLRYCPNCREAVPPEVRARFVSSVVLRREPHPSRARR